jgi:tetratricopeptide (TPR) repeat protein
MSGVYDDYRPYSYRAYAFFMMGDIDKSYDDYDKAIKLGDSNAETAESRLRVMLYRREYRRILDETERTTLSTGDVHAARVFLIRSSANIGISNVVAAIEDLRHAMVCASNDMEAMNNLAWIYVSEPAVRDGCQALYLASKAIAISRRPECLTTLACAYAETGDYSNAVKCISEAYAITNDPEYIEYRTAFLNGTKYIEYVHNKRRGAVSGKNGIELNGESRP